MDTLLELRKDLQTELELMNEFAEENLKSYQVWWVRGHIEHGVRC
jgi:protein farnesyltransferase/geranylgeranyltransferase type-1 subunit alpha